jgi:hypothetical protein
MGEFNAKHFRHSEECCALETYLHKCGKEAFFYRYQQALSREMPIRGSGSNDVKNHAKGLIHCLY